MNSRNVVKVFQANDFVKCINTSERFVKGAIIYAKEISDNIFLLFVLENEECEQINALLANYDALENIGVTEPYHVMFFHSICKDDDIYFFEKYFKLQNHEA